jgi:hypothetical protein
LPSKPGEYAARNGGKEHDGKVFKEDRIWLHVTPLRNTRLNDRLSHR